MIVDAVAVSYAVVAATAAILLPWYAPRRAYRGKLMTMPLRRRHLSMEWSNGAGARVAQYLVVFCVAFAMVESGYGLAARCCVSGTAYAALVADDLLSGFDGRRKAKEIRNRLRWMMRLPAPVATPQAGVG